MNHKISKISKIENSSKLFNFTQEFFLLQYRELALILLLLLFIMTIVLTNLTSYPAISGWDEGMYLSFAKNLANFGEYATNNGNTFERLLPAGGTGPTLIVPVALALSLGGNLLAARLVIVAYFLIALAGAYILVKSIGNSTAAMLSILVFLIAGYKSYDTIWLARQVLAEIPAMAFLLFGIWMWYKSWQNGLKYLIAGSLLIGLSVITKNQLIWTLIPIFLLIYLIDRFYYRQLRWYHTIVPVLCIALAYGAWFLTSIWIVGSAELQTYMDAQKALTNATFLNVSLHRWVNNLKFIKESDQWIIILISIGYCIYKCRTRTLAGLTNLILPLFAIVSTLTFIILNIPWPRYLYLPLAFSALCTGLAIYDFALYLNKVLKTKKALAFPVVILIIGSLIGPRIINDVNLIFTADDTNAIQFVNLIDQKIPKNAKVFGWEWELYFYTDRELYHPPFILFPTMIDQVYNGRNNNPILQQPRIPADTDYLIIGPFASDTQVFTAELNKYQNKLIFNVGPYYLYKLNP
jgi:4-amino-4-deoxy-L-arabinose transferase-like glycosyltransferase